jgi:hypothetical protein
MIEITEEINKLVTALTTAGCMHILVNERFVVGFTADRLMGGVHNKTVHKAEPSSYATLGMTMHTRIRKYIAEGYWLLRIPMGIEVGPHVDSPILSGGCDVTCTECKAANWARLDTPRTFESSHLQWRMYGHELIIMMFYLQRSSERGEWTEYVFDPATKIAITYESFTRHDSARARLAKRHCQGFVIEYMDSVG